MTVRLPVLEIKFPAAEDHGMLSDDVDADESWDDWQGGKSDPVTIDPSTELIRF